MTVVSNISIYYQTVYPFKCTPDSRYLSSKEGLIFWSRVITVSSLPILILTTYCILKKTPENMNFVKASLLNLNSWCLFSALLCFLRTTFSFFPFNAGFTVGLFTDLHVPLAFQLYSGFVLTFAILISTTILFENRSSSIACNVFRIQKSRIRYLWISVNFFGSLVSILPVFMNLPDQEKSKIDILKDLPCPSKEFFTEPFLVMAYVPFWKSYFSYSLMTVYLVLLLQIAFFSGCCLYYLILFKSVKISAATRKIQSRSFFGLLGQTLMPMVFDTVPMLVFLNQEKKNEYDQYNNNLMSLTVVIHNGAASLSILLVHHPYRRFLKELVLGKDKKKMRNARVSVNVSSRTMS